MSSKPLRSASVTFPVATSTTRRRWLRSPQAIFVPSGLKTGANFHGAPSVVRRRGVPEPSWGRIQISYSPVSSER